jgi:hypothetical protein
MHAGGVIGDQTTGSLVAVLRQDKPVTLWTTGCSVPCISAFKPVFWGSGAAPLFDDPTLSFEYWLKRERLHRAVLAGKVDVAALHERITGLEAGWQVAEKQIMSADTPDTAALAVLSVAADREEQAMVDEFSSDDWQDMPGKSRFASYWKSKNAKLGLEGLGGLERS